MVKYKGKFSNSSNILLGIPQGSIMGPLFFLIFINDLVFDYVDDDNIELFADDTTFLVLVKILMIRLKILKLILSS